MPRLGRRDRGRSAVSGENALLRAAREATRSGQHAGECLSRQELAELVNARLWAHHGRRVELDAHYVAKLERGVIRWPNARYREAFRAVLGVETDAELGFANPRRSAAPVRPPAPTPPTPAPTPPTPPTPPALRQLPPAPGRFTGRTAELAALTAVVDGRGVPVLTGAGGIGKTSLALHWAHRDADRFPDGRLFADLRGFGPAGPPADPSTVLRGFLRALGVPADDVPGDLAAQEGLYRSLLGERRVLVVLDNAASTAQVAPLLPGDGPCAALVTSRRVLTGLVTGWGGHHLALGPLDDEQGRALLVRYLGADRVGAEPAAAAELITLCGGFPLALAVFAARALANPRVPLAAFAAELRDLGLDALEDHDAAVSLPAVLSWSCRALTAEEREVFALLGVAPGADISVTAVANLAALPPARARTALRGLVEASLVTRDARDRYGLHDLVRQYAATLRPDSPPEVALRRLVDFRLATALAADRLLAPHRPSPAASAPTPPHPEPLVDAPAALAWFDAEHPTLPATQRAALEHGWHDAVWRMAWSLNTYAYRRGHVPLRVAAWEAALAAADHLPDDARACVHRYLGNARVAAHRVDDGVRHLDHALRLAERLGDDVAVAMTHHDLAGAWEERGDDRRALTHATRALALFRALGDPVWEAFALNDAGWYAARVGDHAEARRHCAKALELHRRHGNQVGQAAALDSLGFSHHHDGDHEQAVTHYRAALELYRALDHPFQVARTLDKLGEAHAALGEHDRARDAWREAVELCQAHQRTLDAQKLRTRLDRLSPVPL
nr:hypothetical protein GCM10017745_51570 [Saccharothrix mutabilis subsp. capreolus]